jgi:hypothetical protein
MFHDAKKIDLGRSGADAERICMTDLVRAMGRGEQGL